MRALALGAFGLAMLATPSLAFREECRLEPDFRPGAISVGVVRTTVRTAHFHNADEQQTGHTLTARSEVLVSPPEGHFVCAVHVADDGTQTQGWLKLNDLDVRPARAVPDDLFGSFLGQGSAPLDITPEGDATARLAGGETEGASTVRSLATRAGEIDAVLGTDGAPVTRDATAADCTVKAKPVGTRYLMVKASRACRGGPNFSFNGFYVRKPEEITQ